MTEPQNPPVVEPTDASGQGESNEDRRPSYESYQKVLGEKKAMQDRASTFETQLKELQGKFEGLETDKAEAKTKRMEEKEQFKELYTKTQDELKTRDLEISGLRKDQTDARKMHSFLDAIKADVKKQYWGLVDLDKIAMDGDSIDEFSVQKYVEDFRTSYPDIISAKETRTMPGDTPPPGGGTSSLTYAQWLKLPSKEKQETMDRVDPKTI